MNESETGFEELFLLVEEKKYKKLVAILTDRNEVDIAEFIEQLEPEQALIVFRTLPKDLSADVFACLDIEDQTKLISGISETEIKSIIENLAMDDAVDMIEELPANMVKKVLKNATVDTRKMINEFLKYPENSAGSIMTSEYVSLRKEMKVSKALNHIRENGVDSETIYTCYVLNSKRELEGVVTLKDLVMSEPDTIITDIMDDNVMKAVTTEDQEEIAAAFTKYDLLSLPVVDKENRLVGIITVDDMVDVMEQEATEDFEKMAAMVPSEKPYLKTSVFSLAKNRIVWLLLLMVSSMFTGAILEQYQTAFAAVPLLVTFIPMLTGTGGNAGSQSSTLIIRGMTLGEIKPSNALLVLWKELRVAVLCGIVLAAVNFVRLVIMYPGNNMVCLTVVLSLFGTVVIAKSIGCLLPILARILHLDPAIMAAPLISTIVDACSLVLYFTIACHLLDGIG